MSNFYDFRRIRVFTFHERSLQAKILVCSTAHSETISGGRVFILEVFNYPVNHL